MYSPDNVLINALSGYMIRGMWHTVLDWSDATTPRTDTPVRFCYLAGAAPQSCIARGYMEYARPVRFLRTPPSHIA